MPAKLHQIQQLVANYYGVSVGDVLSSSRSRSVVHARHVAMWFCRTHTKASLNEIGRAFGRDHATVMTAVRCIARALETDGALKGEISEITRAIEKSQEDRTRHRGMTSYALQINEKHAEIIADALDLYVRIGLGQFEEIVRVYDRKYALSPEVKQRMVEKIQAAKVLAGHTPHGSYGLLNPEVSDWFRVAYDILQVVRDRNVSSPAVAVDEGIRVAEGEPLPTIAPSEQF